MGGDAVALDREFLLWCLQQPEVPHHKLARLCPDFLVISPPKTGSTWLAANFRCHPQLFVPGIKEIRYFSSLFKWFDLGWYLDHFGPGTGRVKGEASPSYAPLPLGRIRLIRRLLPKVKLIFLMRNPVARAWSHAKHNFSYREANFAGCTAEFANVTDTQWRENFTHDWPLVNGDYLGQLRRWLSVFPREQVYVGFYESIARRPEKLLRDLFGFLGVDSAVDLSTFPVAEKILAGLTGELSPPLEQSLHRLLHERTQQLASFLREHFNLEPPPEWHGILTARSEKGAKPPFPVSPEAFRREFEEDYLSRVLEQEETFPAGPRPVVDEYRGYNIVLHRRRMVAVEQRLDPACLDHWEPSEVQCYQESGSLFLGPSLAAVKERINRHVFERFQTALRTTETLSADLREAQERIASIEHALQQRPWYVSAVCFIRNTWRRFLTALSRRRPGNSSSLPLPCKEPAPARM